MGKMKDTMDRLLVFLAVVLIFLTPLATINILKATDLIPFISLSLVFIMIWLVEKSE